MNIEFIKWMCEKAEGFCIWGDKVRFIPYGYEFVNIDTNYAYYPLLLQRAIEGVNNGEEIEIIQTRSNISVIMHSAKPIKHFEIESETIDHAKQSALEYIYNQEQKG